MRLAVKFSRVVFQDVDASMMIASAKQSKRLNAGGTTRNILLYYIIYIYCTPKN
jgi:hypothetical protein